MLTSRPLPAPMIDVQRRDAPAQSPELPLCTENDFAGQDGYATFMARLEIAHPAWFDEFSRVDAGHSHPLELAEIMVRAPHPFLAGMAYGKMLERMTATRSWYGAARKTIV